MSIWKNKPVSEYYKPKEESFPFDQIGSFATVLASQETSEDNYHTSDNTWIDLDLDDVFMYADRTYSKVGQQYLYARMRGLTTITKNDENVISSFSDDSTKSRTINHLLKLNKQSSYYILALFSGSQLSKPSWFWIIRLFSFLCFALLLASFWFPWTLIALIPLFIVNTAFHLWNKSNIFSYTRSIPELIKLQRVASDLLSVHDFLETEKVIRSIKSLKKATRLAYLFKLESGMPSDITMIADLVLDICKILFLIEPISLFSFLKTIEDKRKDIQFVYEFVGTVDSCLSIHTLRKSVQNWCIPTENQEHNINAVCAYHPLIQDCIENSMSFDKSILLTGSNMSGKTTFIRTIGINVILGQTINTCFAKAFEMPRAEVHSCIRISDDVQNDKSYYFEEVLRIKNILDKTSSQKQHLFLLDEVFKGTNTIERISAAAGVLSYLAERSTVMVSTHDLELTTILSDNYGLYHFSESIEDNKVKFDYLLKSGVLKKPNALKILEINGYPNEVLEKAKNVSEQLKATHYQLSQ